MDISCVQRYNSLKLGKYLQCTICKHSLLQDLKDMFAPESLTVSSIVSGIEWRAPKAYQMEELAKHLDLLLINTVNYKGPWDLTTGHGAPLYGTWNACWNIVSSNVI